MKKTISKLFLAVLFLLFYVNGYAEQVMLKQQIKDKSEILGLWQVVATAPACNKEKKQTSEKWEFKNDGSLVVSAFDRRARSELHTPTQYTIENGLILVTIPGRPGKFFRYQVYNLEASSMTIVGGLEGCYFLEKNN